MPADNLATAWHGRIALWTLYSVAILILPIAIFVHRGLAPLFAVAATAILVRGLATRSFDARPGPFVMSVSALVIFSGISVVWSIAPGETLKTTPSLAAMCLGGVLLVFAARVLEVSDKAAIRRAIVIGGAIGYAIFTFEWLSGEYLIRTSRAIFGLPVPDYYNFAFALNSAYSIAAIFLWPWVVALRHVYSRRVALAGFVVALVIVWFAQSEAPKYGVLIGAVAAILAFAFSRRIRWLAGATAVFVVAAMPYIATILPNPLVSIKGYDFLSPSAQHRLVIWRTTVDHIKKRPILGIGFDTARDLYSGKDAVILHFRPDEPGKTWANDFAPIPLHPHNGVLQVWLELGAVGAVILAALLIAIILAIERAVADRLDKAICYGAFGSGMFIALISFGAWQNWWICGLFLCGALMAGVVAREPNPAA